MASKLPDETLLSILSLVLEVPDDDFANVSGIHSSPFADRQYSTADTLLVCKRWMRIATPLLYDTVILRSIGQAQALAKALKKNPAFAPYQKKLRIEGGFGASVGKALRAASALSDLCICLELNSKDNVTAMCSAFPAINPARLILSSPFSYTSRATTTVASITEALPKWTNLSTVVAPSPFFCRPSDIVRSLCEGMNPKDVYLKGRIFENKFVETPLQLWPRCTVHLSAEHLDGDSPATAALLARYPARIAIRRTSPPPVQPRQAVPSGPADLAIHRAPAEVQLDIWTRVLFHALQVRWRLDPCFRSRSAEPVCTNLREGPSYIQVCKLFRDIVERLAVSHIAISYPSQGVPESLHVFFDRRPDLQSRVQSLYCWPELGPEKSASLIARTPNLRRLSCLLGLSDAAGMSKTIGASLVDLFLCLPAPLGAVTPATLSFPLLRRLELRGFDGSNAQEDALNLDLPLLHELILPDRGDPWLYKVISRSQLPNIRFLGIPHVDPTAVTGVLVTHGHACVDLSTDSTHVGLALSLCPDIRTLSLEGEWVDSFNKLDPALVHPSLTRIELPGLKSPRCYVPAIRKTVTDEITAYFSGLTGHMFPSLRVIQGGRLEWPTIPREIHGSHVAKWAEILQEKGITLLDATGKGWRPRVRPSRGG